MEIISRKDAKALGLKRYYTGKPCKYGHVAERYIKEGCVECHKISQSKSEKKMRKINPFYNIQCHELAKAKYPEKIKARNKHDYVSPKTGKSYKRPDEKVREQYWENPEKFREQARKRMKKYIEKNRVKINQRKKEYRIKAKLAKQEKQPT